MNSDPLVDSDEENPDEHIRRDYSEPIGSHILSAAHLIFPSQPGDLRSLRESAGERPLLTVHTVNHLNQNHTDKDFGRNPDGSRWHQSIQPWR